MKFRHIHFVGNLILSTSYEFITMTSLWRHLWTLDMATLPLKWAHKEQRSVIRLLWAKGLNANAIQSEMRPVYGDKYFTRPAVHVWCKKFAYGRESVVDEEWPGRRVVSTTYATIVWSVSSLISYMVCFRLVITLVVHNIRPVSDVKTCLLVEPCSLAFLATCNLQCCSTNACELQKKTAGQTICTDWLCSKYKWRHSNDVTVIKIPMYVPNWIPNKT